MCLEVHRLRAIHHHNAPAALSRGQGHEAGNKPRGIHIDVIALALTTQRIGVNREQISMAIGGNTPKHRVRRF